MANNLTGDFDVVAEFSALAVNRVLAAMHATERFPHSMTLRVRDNAPPGSKPDQPTIVGSTDTFGDPTADHNRIGSPVVVTGQFSAADPRYWTLDPVVNTDVVSADLPPLVPSKLQGRAQLQLSPPTIEVTSATGTNITVKLKLMARYFPDAHTPPVAEFVRGELLITAPVNQVAKQKLNVIDVDIRSPHVNINFLPEWSSHPVSANQPLSAEDVAAINQLIRNALKTSFLPSNTPLPSNINFMRFKTLLGGQSAIAVLLNMVSLDPVTGNPLPPGNPGNPATVNDVFLAAGDHFAFGLGIDYLRSLFINMLNKPIPPQTIHVPIWGSATYMISLSSVSLDIPNEKIVVTIKGHAHTSKRRFPDFNFTVHLAFTLKTTGTTADLSAGEVSVDTDSGLVNNFGKGRIRDGIRAARNAALSEKDANGLDAYDKVNRMLSTDENLGKFLNSLLKPPQPKPGDPPPQEVKPVLAYTSVEYRPSGIVLHGGWMTVPDPPPVHVEFEQIPSTGGGGGGVAIEGLVPAGPDYSALKTWIPGGAIQQYAWSWVQGQVLLTDQNKFVFAGAPMPIYGYGSLCLTVRGLRFPFSGPVVVEQPVSATVCGYNSFPIVEGLAVARAGALPLVALTQPGPHGLVEIVGHTAARPDGAEGGTPNRIVHFADERTAGHLEFLTKALRESKREDAPAAILAVLPPGQLTKARYTEGVIYAEDEAAAWARAFGVKDTRPLTVIVAPGPKGDVVWQHEGELDSGTLAAALRRVLVKSGPVSPRMLGLSLRIGRPAPDFLFELAPGRWLTLRKLVGRPVQLVFAKFSLKPSLEAVRDLPKPAGKAGAHGPVVLAINDGEATEVARKAAAENLLSAIVVADPKRRISLAYGVNIWPTIVFLDAFGLVREIRYGRVAGEQVERPTEAKAATAQSARKMA